MLLSFFSYAFQRPRNIAKRRDYFIAVEINLKDAIDWLAHNRSGVMG